METTQIKLSDEYPVRVTLTVKPPPLLSRYVLGLFTMVLFCLPLASCIYGLLWGSGPHLGYVFLLLCFAMLGVFVLRIYLWISYGKEEIEFSQIGVKYMPSSRYFTGPGKSLKSPYSLSYMPTWEEGSQIKGVLTIISEGNEIRTAVKLPFEDLERLYVQLTDIMPWMDEAGNEEMHLSAS